VVAGVGLTRESNELFIDSMIQTRRDSGKAVVLVKVPGFDLDLGARACQAGVPFFDSVERAMDVYAKVRNYQVWRDTGRRVSS
jgi:acyl-CoA synthetase (NDP forming)